MRPEILTEPRLGTLSAAFERTGTPAWVMRVIQQQGFDLAEGFQLDLELTGDGYKATHQATAGHLLSGEVDLIDTDWISLGRLRTTGVPVSAFHPYGRIMGGLVVASERMPEGLDSLDGRRIAVTSRFDKTWLMLRAFAVETGRPDPAQGVQLVETASKQEALDLLQAGEVDGAVLFWHLAAIALIEARFELAFDALDAVETLTGAALPTTFFVAADARLRERPDLFQAFTRAFDAAVQAMRTDEALWREGAGHAAVNGHARPLREAWLRRISLEWPDRLPHRLTHCFEILKTRLGHEVPGLDALPDGSFSSDFLAVGDLTA